MTVHYCLVVLLMAMTLQIGTAEVICIEDVVAVMEPFFVRLVLYIYDVVVVMEHK